MAKIDAHSKPSSDPGNSAMKNVTVMVRKPRMGTDWRMSSRGDQHRPGPAAAGRRGSVGEREHNGEEQCDEHPQQRTGRVVNEVVKECRSRQRTSEGPTACEADIISAKKYASQGAAVIVLADKVGSPITANVDCSRSAGPAPKWRD